MGTHAPDTVKRLVDSLDQDRKVLLSGDYKEEQLRAEFLNPFFSALGWGMDNTLDTIQSRNWGSVPLFLRRAWRWSGLGPIPRNGPWLGYARRTEAVPADEADQAEAAGAFGDVDRPTCNPEPDTKGKEAASPYFDVPGLLSAARVSMWSGMTDEARLRIAEAERLAPNDPEVSATKATLEQWYANTRGRGEGRGR
jgi:hypothetical protein